MLVLLLRSKCKIQNLLRRHFDGSELLWLSWYLNKNSSHMYGFPNCNRHLFRKSENVNLIKAVFQKWLKLWLLNHCLDRHLSFRFFTEEVRTELNWTFTIATPDFTKNSNYIAPVFVVESYQLDMFEVVNFCFLVDVTHDFARIYSIYKNK